jgi:hypothetical protein
MIVLKILASLEQQRFRLFHLAFSSIIAYSNPSPGSG